MAKQTREERQAAKLAEQKAAADARFTRKVRDFRERFEKDASRKVFTKEAAFEAFGQGDRIASVLYDMFDDYERLARRVRDKIASAQRNLSEALERMDAGRDAAYYSNGVLGSNGQELDQLALELQHAVKALAQVANAGGWRVRELEDARSREKHDGYATIRVAFAQDGGYVVARGVLTSSVTELEFLGTGGFGERGAATTFPTFELAWSAIAVYVNGRPLD